MASNKKKTTNNSKATTKKTVAKVKTKKPAKKAVIVKKATTKKVVSRSLAKKSTPKIVETKPLMKEKLRDVMEVDTSATEVKTAEKKLKSFPWWPLISITLFIILVFFFLYEKNNDFKKNVDNFTDSIGITAPSTNTTNTQTEAFELKINAVYNAEDQNQRSLIENYFANIEGNLANTKVVSTWTDKNSLEAQEIIEKIDAKYLPIFVTDENIQNHPLYYEFAPAIENKNGIFFFKSEGIEYLQTPEVGDARYNGANPDRAEVVVVEYASYTCGFCKQMHPVLRELEKTYGNKVSFVTKNFDRGGIDSILSQTAECAADQGRYDQMTDALYDRQGEIIATIQAAATQEEGLAQAIAELAVVSKVNATTLRQCIDEGKYANKVAEQTAEGQSFGVLGTPSFFINKQFVGGAIPQENFEAIIEAELNK